MRVWFVYIFITWFAVYAWRNWLVSLCALIVMSAVHEHEDMPHYLFELRGLGPWNALFFMAFLAWINELFRTRRRIGLPGAFTMMLGAYLILMFVAVCRGAMDVDSYRHYGPKMTLEEFFSDNLVNALKYILPALMLFDACRTRKRVLAVCACIGALVLIDALLVIKRIPLSTLLGETDTWLLRRRVGAVTGHHPNDMALMLVITIWSIIGFRALLRGKWRWAGLGACSICTLALGLCYSRAGFAACIGTGLILGLMGSKRILLILLGVLLPLGMLSPSIRGRATQGFTSSPTIAPDDEEVTLTAGRREFIWPIVLEAVSERPVFGHGRHAANRVLVDRFRDDYGMLPGHAHNAYLGILLDMGLVGLVPVLGLFGYLTYASTRLIRYRGDPLRRAVGNMGLAGVATLMIMGISGQQFFPSENLFVFFCVQGVLLRVYTDTFSQPQVRRRGPPTQPIAARVARGGAGRNPSWGLPQHGGPVRPVPSRDWRSQ